MRALLLATVIACVASCAVGGPGYYDGGVDVGYVGGFYEPCCYDYGGWGGRYRVGPPRGEGWHPGAGHPSSGPGRPGGGAGHPGGGRPAPSIPSRPRGR
jgi:hypothetical protein